MPLAETNRPRSDAGNSSNDITKPRKKRTKKVPRVSGVGPPLDPQTELRMIQQVVERDLFPSCKFINGSVDLDNIAKNVFAATWPRSSMYRATNTYRGGGPG